MRTRSRNLPLAPAAVIAASLIGTALIGPAPGDAAIRADDPFPTVMDLPDGWQPEGITIGAGQRAWLGSRADGSIYELDLKTGEGEIVSQGPGTASVGLKVDRLGRLFVAGGPSGSARVVDTETGAILENYQLASAPTFVNDVLLHRKAAWFTDSQKAQLYKVPLGEAGALPDASEVETLPLTGEWAQLPGFNANGISRTPDHKALLVVNSAAGSLYRVDPETGVATVVDLGGTSLTNGDGMLLVGNKLYVVRNQLNQVAVLKLDADGTAGTLQRTITSPDFDVPTTVARFGSRLYLPNARFSTPPTPTTTYTVVQVPANATD